MIVTVTPNSAVDLTYLHPDIRFGETNRVPTAVARAGGKGLNVARVIHQQGQPVLAVATAGGRTGQALVDDLVQAGIRHYIVAVEADTRRTIALVDSGREQTTILNEHGQNHTRQEWLRLTGETTAALAGARCLVGSGSLPSGADEAFYAQLVKVARERGIPSIIDTSGPGLLAAARSGASVLKPNREELVAATGMVDPVGGARALVQLGAGLVLVSLGERGMLAVSREHPHSSLHARLPRVLAGNATGAGDAAVAAVAVSLAAGITNTDALLRQATAWSAAAVLMPLAGEISPQFTNFVEELVVDRLVDEPGP
ncbi:1-phosphofructokinase family hexose kinase [Cryobacterium sp. TMT1-66-1]|uniref:1-phosphofructokinase family hexose kinase n=1 Tax=Cryobacterium sp. TMT1-66-1 TaxID=1259242 RepID=UPI00106DBE88|nr:hexose kinase [Cryobacterium sp. TMT1-66-1]TFD06521.1 1-phosphofructokinase family hexose kinase [Cryobacterium sp. TMT1-66-1]